MLQSRNQLLIFSLAVSLLVAGCTSSHIDPPLAQAAPRTGKAPYWYGQPSIATVASPDYDKLWLACEDEARACLFSLDREDYRDGLLSTKPMISKQFFELWRPDTGDVSGVAQNSLQMIRRTIRFRFDKSDTGYIVTPKVLIERYSQPTRHITSVAEYSELFNYEQPDGIVTSQAEVKQATSAYWYSIGRDTELEKQLANGVKNRLR